MPAFKHWILLWIGLFLVGCETISQKYRDRMDTFSPRSSLTDVDRIQRLEQAAAISLERWYQSDGANRIGLRDSILESQLQLADAYFLEFERELMRGRATTELSLDLANLFFTTGATIMGGESNKTILAGLASYVAGSKLAINENLYFKQTAPALIAKMHAMRAAKYRDIIENRNRARMSYDNYTIIDVDHDLVEYYQAGTIYAAISDITREAKSSEDQANQDIRQIRMAP